MKFLLLIGLLSLPALYPASKVPLQSRRITLRSIQAFQNGKLLPDSVYQLSTVDEEGNEKPLLAGVTVVAADTRWSISRDGRKYWLRDVAECVQYNRAYDLRLDFHSKEIPLQCLTRSYYAKNGDQVTVTETPIEATRATCDVLSFVPVPPKRK